MVSVDVSVCPRCGGALKYYGMVPRIVRTKNRATSCELTMENWKSQEPQLLLWRNPYLKGETEHETYTCGGRT